MPNKVSSMDFNAFEKFIGGVKPMKGKDKMSNGEIKAKAAQVADRYIALGKTIKLQDAERYVKLGEKIQMLEKTAPEAEKLKVSEKLLKGIVNMFEKLIGKKDKREAKSEARLGQIATGVKHGEGYMKLAAAKWVSKSPTEGAKKEIIKTTRDRTLRPTEKMKGKPGSLIEHKHTPKALVGAEKTQKQGAFVEHRNEDLFIPTKQGVGIFKSPIPTKPSKQPTSPTVKDLERESVGFEKELFPAKANKETDIEEVIFGAPFKVPDLIETPKTGALKNIPFKNLFKNSEIAQKSFESMLPDDENLKRDAISEMNKSLEHLRDEPREKVLLTIQNKEAYYLVLTHEWVNPPFDLQPGKFSPEVDKILIKLPAWKSQIGKFNQFANGKKLHFTEHPTLKQYEQMNHNLTVLRDLRPNRLGGLTEGDLLDLSNLTPMREIRFIEMIQDTTIKKKDVQLQGNTIIKIKDKDI